MNAGGPVVVTTDGSAHSHRILPHAAQLAAVLEAPLLMLQVVERENEAPRAVEEGRSTLARLGIAGDVTTEVRGRNERTADAVLRAVQQQDAVVLAMDSRGHGALRHALHGSVALDVLGSADLPMLVSGPNIEPPPASATPYRIVATSDGSSASEAVLRALAALPRAERMNVTLLRVHEREPRGRDEATAVRECEEQLRQARALLPESMQVETLVREIPMMGGIDTAIREKASELDAHAIAMSTHGYSARRHVVMGSIAMTMLGRSSLPLLLARAKV